ncbi:unnamed protein product [Toxocara canis]|uniref:Secreted protein n=1 Tax=Toxocara canis TaxID=6265 RepID=A0A183VGB8_TOXCA|nr:unnamed protein product [Toxocara canis]
MQSRFALSGLSLCLITIILLWISVVTRFFFSCSFCGSRELDLIVHLFMKRLSLADFQLIGAPRTSRSRAVCEFRHFMQAARNADVRLLAGACGSRSPHFLRTDEVTVRVDTPPPEYCATPQEAPPSYEEATQAGRVDAFK